MGNFRRKLGATSARSFLIGATLWGVTGCQWPGPKIESPTEPVTPTAHATEPAEPEPVNVASAPSPNEAANATPEATVPDSAVSAAPGGAAPSASTAPTSAAPASTVPSNSTQSAEQSAIPPYDVPARTSEELSVQLVSACERAKREKRPVLLEFGAAWCKDCRRLGSLSHVEPLASELGQWERVEVNITDPDEHEQLMQTFAVRAIAHWQALLPTRCDAAIGSWRRLASRTVEPKRTDTETAEKLATWLAHARKSVRSGR